MRQTLHIFRKDSRQFRIPIALLIAWTGLFAWTTVQPWQDAIFDLPESYRRRLPIGVVGGIAALLFPLAWGLLIAQVIHAESLVGERQFWLTRPYHRGSLAAAKALFVLAYVTLPLTLAQAAIVVFSGLPLARFTGGLVWEQLLVTLVVLMPAAALAALTPRLSQFALVALGAPVLMYLSGGLMPMAGLDWVRSSIFVALLGVLAATVLVLQFWRRQTPRSRLVALAGTLALVGALPLVSWPAAFAVQARVQRAWDGTLEVNLVRGLTLGAWSGSARGLQLEFQLRGLPEGAATICRADEITIRTAAGATHRRDTHLLGVRVNDRSACPVYVPLPSQFLESVADRPSTIEAVLYVTVLGPERIVLVPTDGVPVGIPGGAVCAARIEPRQTQKDYRDFTGIECRTAFRESSTLVNWQSSSLGDLSLSPWPATLRLAPVSGDAHLVPGGLPAVPVTVRKPIAHVRTTVTATDIRLRDFELGR